jgi:hypothetical protein
MRLLDRYKRLGLWTKVGVWGSIASVVGLVITLVIAFLPSSTAKSASTTGNSSPAILATGPNAHISINYSDSTTSQIVRDKDDLVASITTLIGFDNQTKGQLYSDVLFINNGQDDATLETRQFIMMLNRKDIAKAGIDWFGAIAWDQSTTPIRLPARKTTSIRFPFRKDFMNDLQDIFKTKTPYDFKMTLLCTVIDSNGSAHTVHKYVGTLHLTPTHWRTTRSSEEEVSLRLLPSRVTRHTTSSSTPCSSPEDLIRELRKHMEQLDNTQ